MTTDTTAHEPINTSLLFSVLRIQSKSGQEEQARIFLRAFFTQHEIPFYESCGNLYATKDDGSGPTVPFACVVSHIDTVHDIVATKELYYKAGSDKNELIAGYMDELTERLILTGVGGDDLVGLALCLELMLRLPKVKCAFFHSEEIGTVGSKQADISFFSDVSMILQGDRRGKSDITEAISGKWMNSKEWREAIDPLIKQYGRSWCDGALTDVLALKTRESDHLNWKDKVYAGVNVCVANMSCGYYNPHSVNEYVKIDEVEETLHFMLDVFKLMGHQQWLHAPEKKIWTGASGGGYKGGAGYTSKYTYGEDGKNAFNQYDARMDKTSLNYFVEKGWASKDAILEQYEYIKTFGWCKKRSAAQDWEDVKVFAEDNMDGTHSIWKYNLKTQEWQERIVLDSVWDKPKKGQTYRDWDWADEDDAALVDDEHPTGSCPDCGGTNLEADHFTEHASDKLLWWCNDCQSYHDERDINKMLLLGAPAAKSELGEDDLNDDPYVSRGY